MPVDPAGGAGPAQLEERGDLLYASAACQVDLWMIAQGGPAAVPTLLSKLHDGQSFDALYKPGG